MHATKTLSDFELVDLAKNGDNLAFEEIVIRSKSVVATVAMNMLADPLEATEIGQQVFIQLYRSLHKFRKEAKLSTYLTKITINLSLNYIKRRKTFIGRTLDLNSAKFSYVDNSTSNFENKELINQALQLLNEKHRSVIVVRMIQGFDTNETAKILNIPKGTVLSRLKRGMEKMKNVLEKDLHYEHK